MCFSNPKQQSSTTPPVIIPTPSPSPNVPEETASAVADRKRRQAAAYQNGLASTIKTSGQGDTSSVNLLAPSASAGKKKLGE